MKRRLLSLLLAVVMVLGLFPTAALADNTPGTVRVIVENTTYSTQNGAPWDGTLVDTNVALAEDSTMMSCIGAALKGYDTVGLDSGYISSIHHLAAYDGGGESGWMGTLNDWFVNVGFDSFTVANGTLCAGDEIRVMYTRTGYGADLGGSFETKQGYLSALSASSGSLSPIFDKDILSYTLTVPSGVNTVDITATAENKQDKVTVSVGETEYRRGVGVPVQNGTVIAIACGEKTYTVTVQASLPDASITVPGDATLFVGEKTGNKHYVPFTPQTAAATKENSDGTVTYYYDLKTNSQYNYRISGEGYVTYAGVFKKTANYSLTVTQADLQPEGKTSKTVDHDVTSNNKYNVADIYLNINAQNYLKLAEAGDTYQLVNLRNWETVDTITSNYFIEPDYHYTVLNENGQADTSVVTVSDNGVITAKQAGTAIVLVTYDAINVVSAAGGPFFGAIWPENTGVFVVSVGAQDSGITTGMTINEAINEGLSFKNDGTALDAEHDVIYFLGESGSYTFTPGTEGVTVTVANPTVGETMTFSGFTGAGVTTEGGAVTVPLKEGRNIVKLEKDGKAEYQVITAKQLTVTINDGNPVKPGDTVSIKFSTVYHPINKLAGVYNYTPAIVYTQVEGCEDQMVGSKGSQYQFAATEAAQTVSYFMTTKTQWGATMLATGAAFTIPEDYTGTTLTLSGGTIGFGGWGSWAGEHRRITLETGKLPNLNAASPFGYLGQLPDIVIPVEQPEIAVTGVSLDKTELTLTVGGSETLTATVKPDNATDKTVTWTTSNAAVATVDNGTVTAVAAGNATITAQAGEESAACAVTVQAPLPDASITVPGDATLFVGEKTGNKHYVPFTPQTAAATKENSDGTVTYYYDLKTNSQYNYRISGEGYVTYAGVFKKTANYSLTVTQADLQPEGKTSKTVDHDVTSNNKYNVADIYLNINAQNYLKLAEAGDTYQLVNLRNWETVDTITSNYFIEPDYHYTVLNENGQADTSVVTVSDNGVITAKQAGTAIVLVTYDAINVVSAAGGPFFGAIWPENTGVFVVSVGAQDSGITTGMTINEAINEGLSFKNDGTALDAEHDVIYFLGESGSYTFTPGTEGVTVTVANPTVGETMTFSGFTGAGVTTEGGAVTVPLKEGRNIVKLEKDGKAEYQVITAKQLTVTINDGNPVKPGDTVSIKFSTVYHPINKLAGVYNYTPAIVYTQVEGCEDQMVGSKGSQYQFAATEAAQTVSYFMTTKTQWGATMLATGAAFTIPEDYTGTTLTLSGGTIGFGGWGSWAGEHRRITLESGKLPNLNAASPFGYLGQLPDIVIPVEQPEIAVTPNEMYDASAATLLATEVSTGSTKGEWLMFGLARALDKNPTQDQKTAYLAAVKSYIESSINAAGQLHQFKSTDNSRIALALTALGYDPADFEGHDLLKAFGDTTWATQQGSTGTAFALLALRAADYATSNEQALIDSLLSCQNADGGWAITTGASDLDATAMVIQALAPDYKNARVKDAVDKALAFLAGKMTGDGTVSNGSNPPSAETIAQILVALTELGRNPAADTQFTKNGKTLLDGLTTFYLKDRGFAHVQGGEFNQMATEQAFYALVACRRLAAEADSLYDMTVTRVTKYTVTVAPTVNGRVSVDLSQAAEGAAVTVTTEPDIGYELKSLTVTDASGKPVPLTGSTFTMPAAGVTVTAVFTKTENPAADVEAAIDALTVTKADAKTQAALAEVEKAYQALTDEQKANVKNADKLTALRQTFDRLLASAKQAAKEDLQTWFSVLNEEDYTKENWQTLQKLLLEGLSDIEKAKNTDEIDRILREVKGTAEAIATGEQFTVTFRLIGDTRHQDGVAGHEKYVTWIPTTTYTLEPGATMYDVFVRAIADNALSQTGASSNYVSSIKAPAVLGGYWLSEFDNGRNSGWMYTVNGLHPSVGLKDCMLKDGDRIIWHYVDDYAAEESKFTWLEAEDISPEAYAKKQEQSDAAAFTDVTQNDWFYDDVQFVVENGLFNGTSTTTFSPNAAMNRAMLVTVLYRLEGEPKVTGSSVFDDVAANQWYTDAVIWATGHAIVNGYGNGKFGPTDSITREQMAAILYRYAQYKNYGVKASNSLTHYGDYAQISPYALQALKWANAEGLINGRASTTLAPQGTATRAEVAAILHRFVKNVVKAG